MNRHLQSILNTIQQDKSLTAEQKTGISKSLNDANKELEITSFQLDTIEKVKRTTAIFLEQTIEELEQKRKAVEAKNKELEIESSLERVRTIAMSMKTRTDMLEICRSIAHQLQSLNVKEIRNVQTARFYPEKGTYTNYEYYAKHDKDFITETSYTNNKSTQAWANQMLKGNGQVFITHTKGDELKDWIAYQKTTNVFIDSYLKTALSLNYYWFSLGIVALGISTYDPLTEEEKNLFNRFLKVFELAYRTYFNIEEAEAQARQSQIELAIERVRARTMAMQKSEELSETAYLLFQQFKELGHDPKQFAIGIINEADYVIEYWLTWLGSQFDHKVYMSMNEPHLINKIYTAWKEKKKSAIIDIKGKELKQYNAYRKKIANELHIDPGTTLDEETRLIINVAFFSKGMISVSTNEPGPLEAIPILERFAAVFDGTYIRFLDLQKAEAQAREAQIEAALERVRSKTLAMQKCEELRDVIQTVTTQLQSLNFIFDNTNFSTQFNEKGVLVWNSAVGAPLLSEVYMPYVNNKFIKWMYENMERGTEFESLVLSKKEKNNFFNYYFTKTDAVQAPEKIKKLILDAKGMAISTAFRKDFALSIFNYQGKPFTEEENNIIGRFANVFEQSYTRFLDLQKAEAQTREAQIEASLERVRSSSLAMHKSDELKDVVKIVLENFRSLGLKNIDSVNINIFHEGSKDFDLWLAAPGQDYTKNFRLPYLDHPIANDFFEAIKQGKALHIKIYPYDEKNKYFEYMFEHSDNRNLPEERKKLILNGPAYSVSAAMAKHSSLFIHNYRGELFSEETNAILIRFTKVFDQTYTRFLDLQKAEMQAREAQIEVSLERVRSKAIAMHHPDELDEVLAVLFDQFDILGIDSVSAHMTLIDLESNTFTFRETGNAGHRSYGEQTVDIDSMEIWKEAAEKWRTSEPLALNRLHFPKESLPEVWQVFHQSFASMPDDAKIFPEDYPDGIYHTAGYCKFGYIGMNQTKKATEEEEQIILKFATEFGRLYQRFLDLQKAEAQAREAQIEAGLERVRARTMAMHSSDDVGAATATMFTELEKLGIQNLRGGIAIISPDQTQEVWSVNNLPDSTVLRSIGVFDMRLHPFWQQIFEAHKRKEDFDYYWLAGKDKEDYIAILNAAPGYLAQPINEFPDVHIQSYFFGEGGIWTNSLQAHTEEQKLVMKKFASVFSLTFRRYQDLQKAEAQAKEAKIAVALERVRSRTLAMQKSDELAETAAVLFRQLIGLGIAQNRLYIGIIKEDSGVIEVWATDEKANKIHTQFTGNINSNVTNKKILAAWKEGKKSITIDMKGKELADYFKYLNEELKLPFQLDLSQKRRIQNIAYFSKGFIGMASPDEQSEESILLLERFAAVFNLTFTRFNDLKIAEAHDAQAELDLIKLKEEKKRTEDALAELKETQKQLIQSEKMASLGELTAGIAHEIQNPLNFVNNFSEVSNELMNEMMEAVAKGNYEEVRALADDVRQNLEKINHHGRRAEAIVKGMLQHSRSSSATKEPTDINKLADEYLRLAYHGLRAKDKSFNAKFETDFDLGIGQINIIPQDIGRVILNLVTNAFYAVTEKKKQANADYEPTVSISTKKLNGNVEIRVKDNGMGIPQKIMDKIFQPFFTTKPTGKGTGLGLSVSYDIITKEHGGELKVETLSDDEAGREGEGSEFIIQLPAD